MMMTLKVTLILSAAAAIAAALRRSSAAVRHMVWMLGLSLVLLVPAVDWLALPVVMPSSIRFAIDGASLPGIPGTNPYGWMKWGWAAGVLVTASRFVAGHFLAAAVIRRARRMEPRDGFEVRESATGAMAFTWGLLRPTVVLPKGGVPRSVWLHERAHAERNDHWWLMIAQAACSVLWFHPLTWLAASRAKCEREQACDDYVITCGVEPTSYAGVLVEAARSSLSPSGAMAFTGQTALESRVRAILDSGIDRRSVTRRLLAISVGAAIALSIPLIAQQPKVYSVKEDGVMPPRVISKVEPRYTKEARDAKISGTVILKIEIDEGGNARNVKIEKGLDAGLDENAIRAVEAWVFEPGKKDGKPVRVAATVQVNFRLE